MVGVAAAAAGVRVVMQLAWVTEAMTGTLRAGTKRKTMQQLRLPLATQTLLKRRKALRHGVRGIVDCRCSSTVRLLG